MKMMIARVMVAPAVVMSMMMIMISAIAGNDILESFTGKEKHSRRAWLYQVDSRGPGQQQRDR